ncbi:membrane protein [Kitasatospora griseola]|uniref:Membrane protein n=1 Tax=Kitasatospora griseola TaxID=2064 RepID=A0A0D0Q5Y9_KITGR|nr:membrane protein [Kitasatospora griseola]
MGGVPALAVLFAVFSAASNAAGTAFQRKAAAKLGRGGGLRFVLTLAHDPAWLIGIAGVTGAALFQALALSFGALALVQPVFVLELPFALLIAAPLLHRRLPRAGWAGVGAVVGGLVVFLASAAPTGGTDQAPMSRWAPVLAGCLGMMAAAVLAARHWRTPVVRAGALGSAAAVGNALTAALLKSATGAFADHGPGAFFSAWQTYGFALTGIAAVLLLENALQAGSLAVSQPALTIGDAGVSLLLGVALFDETVRTGWWLLPELLGLAAVIGGVLTLVRAVPHIQEVVRSRK